MANPNTAVDTTQAVFDTVKFARLISKTYGRNSLTRSAKDTVAQFPMIFSADIPLDDAMTIAKGLEAQYAALLVSIISARSDYDRAVYSNPTDYLKTFHNNANIPTLFLSMDSQLPDGEFAMECELRAAYLTNMGSMVPKELAMECWSYEDNMGGWFNDDSLNSSYAPHAHTQEVMESVVCNLRDLERPAMEAGGDTLAAAYAMNGQGVDKDHLGNGTDSTKQRVDKVKSERFDKKTGKIVSREERPVYTTETRRTPGATGRQEVVKDNRQMAAMEPTLVNLQLTSHHGNAPTIVHNVVMGVKAMVRAIPQEFIISNLSEGVNNSRGMFTFIRWTEGEWRLIRDGIFGLERAKTDAVANRDMRNWLNAIRSRRRGDVAGKATSGQGLPPTTTVIVTSYEVARVAEETGFNLLEPYTAAKLIAKYYLLGFVIYEPETGTLQSMFDGDTSFSTSSVSALRNKLKNSNDTDLTQFAAFLRAAGR